MQFSRQYNEDIILRRKYTQKNVLLICPPTHKEGRCRGKLFFNITFIFKNLQHLTLKWV